MKKKNKNYYRRQSNMSADCDSRHCVFYGGRKNKEVICLVDTCVCAAEIGHAKEAYRRERSF